jgi:hypothetical protein
MTESFRFAPGIPEPDWTFGFLLLYDLCLVYRAVTIRLKEMT